MSILPTFKLYCLNPFSKIYFVFLSLFSLLLTGQTKVFKEASKWGIKDKETVIIAPLYDSIFNFDKEGKVCLACFKHRTVSNNKIMKTVNINYSCNYLNRAGKTLIIHNRKGDTCSVFSLGKNTVAQYTENSGVFVASAKGKRFLIDKNFNQLTLKGYHDISTSVDPNFYIVQQTNEAEEVRTGLIDVKENEIIPYAYASIKINPVDSLIVGCTAGLGGSGEDDVYDYSGKKKDSYHRHVELATKHFVIQKVFEPKEHYILYNVKTKEEKPLNASEIHFFEQDQILAKIKGDWYVYDLLTNEKTEKQY